VRAHWKIVTSPSEVDVVIVVLDEVISVVKLIVRVRALERVLVSELLPTTMLLVLAPLRILLGRHLHLALANVLLECIVGVLVLPFVETCAHLGVHGLEVPVAVVESLDMPRDASRPARRVLRCLLLLLRVPLKTPG
jgi:hypothetical protein